METEHDIYVKMKPKTYSITLIIITIHNGYQFFIKEVKRDE